MMMSHGTRLIPELDVGRSFFNMCDELPLDQSIFSLSSPCGAAARIRPKKQTKENKFELLFSSGHFPHFENMQLVVANSWHVENVLALQWNC